MRRMELIIIFDTENQMLLATILLKILWTC